MIKVENLTVKVTYRVGLGNIEIPKRVYDQIVASSENGHVIHPDTPEYDDAANWLIEGINEQDCMDWEAEIERINK